MTKTLWFEGAGMFLDDCNDVGNCRIRTSFTNDEGKRFYLEIEGNTYSKEWRKIHPEYANIPRIGCPVFCFEILGDDDCNKHRHEIDRAVHFEFTFAEIRKLVNERLGCSFDEVRVAPKNAGYRVHAGYIDGVSQYNDGDKFIFNPVSTARVDEIESYWHRKQRELGEKYPCVSVWRDEEDADLVHVRNFRHKLGMFDYRVDVDDWMSTETEVSAIN